MKKNHLFLFCFGRKPENIAESFFDISGAGTVLGQGVQDQRRQSLERDRGFFAEIGLFLIPKTSFL